MADVDNQQDARLDRLDNRLRQVEEVVVELRAITKMIRPVLMLFAVSVGIDVGPLLL